jgi:hypothetical protein
MLSSDFQEAKNVDTSGRAIMPNTRTASATLHVIAGATVDWLLPLAGGCGGRRTPVKVTAGGPRPIARVTFTVDGRRVATARKGVQGVWSSAVPLKRGRHVVVATAVDTKGKAASARRIVRSCGA